MQLILHGNRSLEPDVDGPKVMTFAIMVATVAFCAPKNSGAEWCSEYSGSNSLTTLNTTFRPNARDFIDALREAGASVKVASTRRPEQRQYLMHWCWRIRNDYHWFDAPKACKDPEGEDHTWFPQITPDYSGDMTDGAVEIIWQWISPALEPTPCKVRGLACNGEHVYQRHGAFDAANKMKNGYGLVYPPARNSRHNEGRAIDMTITWSGDLTIEKKDGTSTTISSSPKNGRNTDLHIVGATYGVRKLVSDPPHWSDDGR
jgi:hypothetical protein